MKAIIPAAGLGVRLLSFTKTSPKEMLPVMGKPAIQFVVEEAVESGFDDILIVTGRGKTSIENHFDHAPELETFLKEHGHDKAYQDLERIANLADIHYIRQKEPLGLGHAVLLAKKHVGHEPFAVMLGDDIVFGETPCIQQLRKEYEETRNSIVAVEEISRERAPFYGVVKVMNEEAKRSWILDLIEKPTVEQAPSNLGILGRYILTPEIFSCIEDTKPGQNGEIQLTDAIKLLTKREAVWAYKFDGKRYDLGNKVDWLKTNVEVALSDPNYREEFLTYLRGLL